MKYKFWYAECTCKVEEPYVNGAKSEWYSDDMRAATSTIGHKLNKTLYWGVHLKGKHVLTVKSEERDK